VQALGARVSCEVAPQAREAARIYDDTAAARGRPAWLQRGRLHGQVHTCRRGAAAGARGQAREAIRAVRGHAHDLPHVRWFLTGMAPARGSGAAGPTPRWCSRVCSAAVSEQPSSAKPVLNVQAALACRSARRPGRVAALTVSQEGMQRRSRVCCKGAGGCCRPASPLPVWGRPAP
jgi:hypothetical protein